MGLWGFRAGTTLSPTSDDRESVRRPAKQSVQSGPGTENGVSPERETPFTDAVARPTTRESYFITF